MTQVPTAAAAPAALWVADPAWRRIDILSDVHLHAAMPRTFDAWRSHLLATPADAVLMLGDLFELWVGDDARHDGFEAECVAVLREAARNKQLAFMPGNRDFLVGPDLLAEAGIQPLADPTVLQAFGQRWLLSHGDALCLSDTAYQRFRHQVRQPLWQQGFLSQPLAERQRQARAMREASAAHQTGMAPEQWSDVDEPTAITWLQAAQAPVLIHGHTHRPARHAMADERARVVMGDWDFDSDGAAPRAQALRLEASGLHMLDVAADSASSPA